MIFSLLNIVIEQYDRELSIAMLRFFLFTIISFLLFPVSFSYATEVIDKIPNNILVYHRFNDERFPSTNTTLKQFEEQIQYLKNNKFIDKDSGEKIPDETIKLLNVQKDATVKQLIKYPELYYAKSSFPLEISQRAFDFLWRMCESYELWCKETGQSEQLLLDITD